MRQPRRILILDPDPMFVKEVSMTLSSRGHEVETARKVSDAVERLKHAGFGCVIVDEDLCEIKGHDAVPVLKCIARTEQCRPCWAEPMPG